MSRSLGGPKHAYCVVYVCWPYFIGKQVASTSVSGRYVRHRLQLGTVVSDPLHYTLFARAYACPCRCCVSLLRVCMCTRRTARRPCLRSRGAAWPAPSPVATVHAAHVRCFMHRRRSYGPASTVLDSATKGRPGRPASLIRDPTDVMLFCTRTIRPTLAQGCTVYGSEGGE